MARYPHLRIIVVPYDAGHRGLRVGAGPQRLLDRGLGEALRAGGRGTGHVTVDTEKDFPAEVATAFELDALVSEEVRKARDRGEFPLVISGNCNTAVGTIAGLGHSPGDLGIVWFDGHPDFNTPETTTSGFSDNMGLSIAVGHCWKAMAGGVPGFSPVAEENVVLAGVGEVEPAERERLAASDITVVGAELIEKDGPAALVKVLEDLRSRVERVYVHLDLDVLDPAEVGRANEFVPEGGFDIKGLQTVLGMVGERFSVAACGVASYDPASDPDGWVRRAALTGLRTLLSQVGPAV